MPGFCRLFLPNRRVKDVALVALLVVTSPAARGDLIFLKDGTTLQGKLSRETKVEVDPAGQEAFRMPVGFYLVDEGARRIYFSQSQVARLVSQQEGTSETRIDYPKTWAVPARGVPPIHQILQADPWDSKWDRRIRIRSQDSSVALQQHLALLTPRFAKVDATTHYAWAQYYQTRELEPQIVQDLMATNPKYADDPKLKEDDRVIRRLRVCDFYLQTGWFDLAEQSLHKLAADFPSRKGEVERALEVLRQTRTRELLETIKRLYSAGQYKTVKAALATFPEKDASENTATDFRSLKATVDGTLRKHVETLRLLDLVAGDLKDAPEGLAPALAGVRAELHPDRTDRLEAFLGQAQQAERQRKAGGSPTVSPGALASLAITGWLLGGPSAEAKPETALKLWRTRELILKYLRAEDAAVREKLLADYNKRRTEFAGLDEICQLIPQLPPEAPQVDTRSVEIELQAGDSRRAPLYLIKVPPEYSHNRLYPVLIALPPSGEPAVNTIRRHEAICAENGFILVVPRWEEKSSSGYMFSDREHSAVLDALRDVRRRFQVDSDRVFLTGAGFGGGDMAFDVGLSHPDLFAGVIPMAAGPSFFSVAYWRNAQYLPFYVVNGDRAGDGTKFTREQFNSWIGRGFNSIWIQYKGRGVEWFGAELPAAFDWMRNKRRTNPLRQLGAGGPGSPSCDFTMMRQTDSRFYWLSIDEIASQACNDAQSWSNRIYPATIAARIDPAANDIKIQEKGVRRLTVWLGRNDKGESMVDFEKPVSVYVGLVSYLTNRKVRPSLEVLLNDLVERGDRQRLFLAKVELKIRD
jgi:hypothetical protein